MANALRRCASSSLPQGVLGTEPTRRKIRLAMSLVGTLHVGRCNPKISAVRTTLSLPPIACNLAGLATMV